MKHSELRHQPRHVNPRIQAINVLIAIGTILLLKNKETKINTLDNTKKPIALIITTTIIISNKVIL